MSAEKKRDELAEILGELSENDSFQQDGSQQVNDSALPDFEDSPGMGGLDDPLEEEIADVGTNWMAWVFGLLILAAVGVLVFNFYRNIEQKSSYDSLVNNLVLIQSGISDISGTAERAFDGDTQAFTELNSLRADLDESFQRYQDSAANHISNGYTVPSGFENDINQARQEWSAVSERIQQFSNNESVLEATRTQLNTLSNVTQAMLLQSETLSLRGRLESESRTFDLQNAIIRQRFLIERMVDNTWEFIAGGGGWEDAVRQFEYDILILGLVNTEVREFAGDNPEPEMDRIDALYQQLVSDADDILASTGDYIQASGLKDQIAQDAITLEQVTDPMLFGLSNADEMRSPDNNLRLILLVLAGFGVIGMMLAIVQHQRLREAVSARRTKRSEDAVIRLLDEMGDLAQGDLTVEAQVTDEITGAIADSVNFAIGEMRVLVSGIKTASNEVTVTTGDSEEMIAQLLTSNDAQSEEIRNAAQEVEKMSSTMGNMSKSALESSERARESAQSAKVGAEAVRNTIVGMNNTRQQIQDTSKRLKRLGESSQQINEIVNLIQDVTEQTNVLSLNASIQAAMAGEAGRGFAVVAEEVQRLADRSARASSEISELVKNIQQDANNAIASMESTTAEVVSGATTADQAGQALDDIERISQVLLDTIERVAAEASEESATAKTVTERMDTLKSATEQSDLSVSQVAAALGEIRGTVEKLDQSVAGFRLPQ